jgi:hypothetical protein
VCYKPLRVARKARQDKRYAVQSIENRHSPTSASGKKNVEPERTFNSGYIVDSVTAIRIAINQPKQRSVHVGGFVVHVGRIRHDAFAIDLSWIA